MADILKRNLTSIAVDNEEKLLGMINVDDVVCDRYRGKRGLQNSWCCWRSKFCRCYNFYNKSSFIGFFNLIALLWHTKNFEGTIEKLAILAAIMPIIASMGGCSGINHYYSS